MTAKKTKLRKIRIIVTTVVSVILLLALLSAVVFVLVSHAKGETPFVGSYSVFWILTPSMEPEIEQRSYILVEKTDPSDVSAGDVICFHSDDPEINGMMNTHRVLEVLENGKSFRTKGDGNLLEDKVPARAENVVAKFVRVLPVLSYVGRMLDTPVGIFGACFLVMVVLVLCYLPDIRRIFKKAEQVRTDKDALMEQMIREEVERLKAEHASNTVLPDEKIKPESKE